jgi:Zn-dependent protease
MTKPPGPVPGRGRRHGPVRAARRTGFGAGTRSIESMDDNRAAPRSAGRSAEPAEKRSGIPLGRLFGVPVHLSPSWLLLAGLVTLAYGQVLTGMREPLPAGAAYAVGFGFVVCLVVSVLLHELGHALTSRRYGIGVRGITLEMLGGFTEMEREAPRPAVELFVSLAGPLVSLVIGLASALVASALPDGTIADEFAFQLALSNIVVAAFNALPGLPLDGGRALQAAVWQFSGDPNLGRRVAGWAGRVLAVATLVTALVLYTNGVLQGVFGFAFTALVAVFMWTGAGQAIRHGQVSARLPQADAREMARPIFAVVGGTPLSEAQRLALVSGLPNPVIGIVDALGSLLGLLSETAADAVPEARRPWVAVGDLSRSLDPAHVLDGSLRGTDLLHAIRADPGGDYLVVSGEDVCGVLRGADLMSLIEPPRLAVRRNAP